MEPGCAMEDLCDKHADVQPKGRKPSRQGQKDPKGNLPNPQSPEGQDSARWRHTPAKQEAKSVSNPAPNRQPTPSE